MLAIAVRAALVTFSSSRIRTFFCMCFRHVVFRRMQGVPIVSGFSVRLKHDEAGGP